MSAGKMLLDKIKAREPKQPSPPGGRAGRQASPSQNGTAQAAASDTAEAKPAPPVPPPFPAYYDTSRNKFFTQNTRGDWICVSEDGLGRMLRAHGFFRSQVHANGLNWAEAELMRIQREQDLICIGPLAGYQAGVHLVAGQRVLVTQGPKLIEPRKGKWPLLDKFLHALLHKWGDHVGGWLRHGYLALRGQPPFPQGQALILAGPPRAGKNVFQSIITEIFGGRMAKPYRYLVGLTSFNRDLIGAEHLAMQDDVEHVDMKARRAFGSKLKDMLVNENQSQHAKGRDALTITPFWRVSISLNEEPENLQILPPLDGDITDKLMMIRVGSAMPDFTLAKSMTYAEWRAGVSAELPGFIHWLLDWNIPRELKDGRFGVKSVLDPELTTEINTLAPEFKLLQIIDAIEEFGCFMPHWEGTSAELESYLRKSGNLYEVERLLTHSNTCGTYLNKLSRKMPNRVQARKAHNNINKWRVVPLSALRDERS